MNIMNIKTKKYKVHDSKFSKELSGYRIALFSDSHNCDFGSSGEAIINILEREKPDVIFFAGDANNTFKNSKDPTIGFDNVVNLFGPLGERFEVYYADGNHEQRWEKLCEELPVDNNYYYQTREKLKASGIHFLDNETTSLCGGKINIFGLNLPLEYYMKKANAPKVEYIESLIGKPSNDSYNILLAHSPIFYESYGEWGADMVLSGHIHGGLVRLPLVGGVLSPYRCFFPKYDYGYYENEKAKMIVSSGCGDHNLREKIFNPLEIVIIELI